MTDQTLEWIDSDSIDPKYSALPIRQIYLWFITLDKQIPIVSNSKGDFQIPGGKPETGESIEETLHREMFEETGIKLADYNEKPKLYGYYLSLNDPNWPEYPEYLKLRYYITVNRPSTAIDLSVNERAEDTDQMTGAKFVKLAAIPQFIPWIKEKGEYLSLLRLIG